MTDYDPQALAGLIVGAAALYAVIAIAVYVWYALALSKVFARLGGEGWKAWVPILNEAEVLTRGGVPGWSVIYYFIPVLQFYGIYLRIQALSRINAQFGRGVGMTVLGILLAPVWASILAWAKPQAAPAYDERVASMMPSAGTGPLADAIPTFATSPEPLPAEAAPPAPTSADSAPPVIHNPWAPTSPLDAPTPTVAVPAAIVPPEPSSVQTVQAVAGPPAAMPAAATPAAPVATPLVAPPAAPPAPDFPVLPLAPEPVAVAVAPEPVVEPAAPAQPEPEPVVEIEPEPEPWLEPSPPAAEPEPAAPAIVFEPTLATEFAPAPAAAPAPVIEPEPEPELEPDEDDYASTVVVDRRPEVRWALLLDDGRSFSLTGERVEVGRKPEGVDPGVQYLPISDTTRTLSKTHARLDLADGQWTVVDLNSTNGVLTLGAGDVETLLPAGGSASIADRFILGKVGMRVVFEEGATS